MNFSPLPSSSNQDTISTIRGYSPMKRQPLILVIEDDQDNLLLLYHLVKSMGCDVLLAKEGPAGLEIFKEAAPDLILLDIVMPRFSGLEVLKHLRQFSQVPSVPIVAVTGLASAKEKQELLQAGCSGYLCKPYLIDDLQTLIRHHLSLPLLLQTA